MSFVPQSQPIYAVQIGAARRYAEGVLGGPIEEQESNPSVTTTAAIAVKGNGDRVGMIIVNVGAQDVFLGLNSGISSSQGIRLGANGGSVTMNVTTDFTLPTRDWWAVAISATSTLYVQEILRRTYGVT